MDLKRKDGVRQGAQVRREWSEQASLDRHSLTQTRKLPMAPIDVSKTPTLHVGASADQPHSGACALRGDA